MTIALAGPVSAFFEAERTQDLEGVARCFTEQATVRDEGRTIEGRDGRSLYDYWSGGYLTLHGAMTRGFPNQFFFHDHRNRPSPSNHGAFFYITIARQCRQHQVAQRIETIEPIGIDFQQTRNSRDQIDPSFARIGQA